MGGCEMHVAGYRNDSVSAPIPFISRRVIGMAHLSGLWLLGL